MRALLILLVASIASAEGMTAEEIYELDKAGVPASLLVAWVRGDGAEAVDTGHILDMQELGTSDAVVEELMVLDSARHDPSPARAVLVVVNRTGAPLGLRIEERQVRLETKPGEGSPTVADGAEARVPVDAVPHEVRLDGRPSGLRVTPLADDVRLELLPKLEGGHGPRARVTCGHVGLFEGPLVQPPLEPSEFRDTNPAQVWSCQVHGDVKKARRGVCPVCRRILVLRRDPNVPPSIPPFLGGPDPEDWDPTSAPIFVCPGHPELWSRSPGNCPMCGVELQLIR